MSDPIFWLGLSLALVAVALLALLITLIPAAIQLSRAARSVERFFDTLLRDLPPTLEALRLTSLDVSDLADRVDDGVKEAGQVVQNVNQSITQVGSQARGAQITVRSAWAGIQVAWQTFRQRSPSPPSLPASYHVSHLDQSHSPQSIRSMPPTSTSVNRSQEKP